MGAVLFQPKKPPLFFGGTGGCGGLGSLRSFAVGRERVELAAELSAYAAKRADLLGGGRRGSKVTVWACDDAVSLLAEEMKDGRGGLLRLAVGEVAVADGRRRKGRRSLLLLASVAW